MADVPAIFDTLIARSKTIQASELAHPKGSPVILKQLVDELIAEATRLPFEDWELKIVNRLRHEIQTYSWVGIYWVKGEHLYLGAWSGPEATEHVKIPIGEGICGLAARTKETVLVNDVHEHSDYLACFPETKSEIVVPILLNGHAIGEIDIDGDEANVYSDTDRHELERLAAAIADHLPRD